MLKVVLRELAARKARLASTAVAVLIGVAFMAGTFIFTDTLGATFDDVLTEANDGVDAMVRAPAEVELAYGQTGDRIDASVADQVRAVDGVGDVAAQITGYAQLIGPDGSPVGDQSQAPAFGTNWITVADLNPYELVDGHRPGADDEIVIDRASADSSGYRPGDVVTVLTKHEPQQFTVVGIASFGSEDSPAGASVVLFTDATAERVLSAPGQVDGIAVTAAPDVSGEELVARLDDELSGDVEVVTGAQLIDEDRAAFDADFAPFRVFMLVFAVVAVFVGAFIINNTFSITVAQRTRQMAMLRAIGASSRQVMRSVLGEALAIGILGSAAGVVVGVGIAQGLETLMAVAGIELPDGPMVISRSAMLVSFAVGVVVTVLSAWLPARRARGIRPVAAMRDVAVERAGASVRRVVTAVVMTVVGVTALLIGLGDGTIQLVGLGAFVSLVGVAMLGPVLVPPLTRVLGVPLKARGVAGDMATRNAMRSPRRTARTASSLMIGVALVAFISVLTASVKTSVAGSLDEQFTGTHVIDSGVWDSRGGLSPELAHELETTPGVETVSEARTTPAVIDGSPGDLLAFTAATIGDLFVTGDVEGDLDGLGTDGLAVTAERADSEGWTVGSEVGITLADGTSTFVVRAIFDDSEEWIGPIFVDVAAFDAHLADSLDTRMYVAGTADAVTAATTDYPTADVLDRAGFVADVNSELDQILGVVYAMLALAVVIALLGITNTLALSVHERTRELGLLRAVGMVRSQIRATIRWEAVLVALFGTTLGLGVGVFFGWATVRALAAKGIDTLTLPAPTLVVICVIAAVSAAVAAVVPARRAARMNVLEALATE